MDISNTALFDDKGFPTPHNPDYWSIVAKMIDEGIDEHKDRLKSWSLVRRVPLWYPTIDPLEVNFLSDVQKHYRAATPEKRARLQYALREPYLGHTDESYEQTVFDFGIDHVMTSGWCLKNAHHILKCEEFLERDITEYDHIVEIGGGIGDLARYCVDLGFTGQYTILDLPATLKIQKAYLGKSYPVTYASDVSQVPTHPNTLVIATWSLSEIGYTERSRICQFLAGAEWFVIFQSFILGMRNTEWFVRYFQQETRCKTVQFEAMPIHLFQGGAFYVYGR